MTGSDRTTSSTTNGEPIDPWAPGGALAAVPSAPSELTLTFASVETSAPRPDRRSTRRWMAGGVALGLMVIGTTVATSGDGPQTEPAESNAVDESLPATVPESRPRATPPPLMAEPATAAEPPPPPDPTPRIFLTAAPREFVIDIAPALAEILPTEVVALQREGGLYEVSLPSGRVRVTDLGFDAATSELVANDGGAVVWPTPEGGAQVMSTCGELALSGGGIDAVSWRPGSTSMYLWGPRTGLAGSAPSVVDVEDGLIAFGTADWIDPSEGPADLLGFGGELLRRDSGGTYLVGPTSTVLLTTGDVVASGTNHLLLRECDATRVCHLASLGRDGTRVDWPTDIPGAARPVVVGGLSPGGDALLLYDATFSAETADADTGPVRSIDVLELADGTIRPLRPPQSADFVPAWDSAGAGIFIADPMLVYIDRFTGSGVVVSDDLPLLRSVATRRPRATPICEVLAIAQPRFVDMERNGDDNTEAAPPTEVLARLQALAPEPLATDIDPLITFVTGFVSPEVADSQTVANWPADVRSGLAALRTYAAAECPPSSTR